MTESDTTKHIEFIIDMLINISDNTSDAGIRHVWMMIAAKACTDLAMEIEQGVRDD